MEEKTVEKDEEEKTGIEENGTTAIRAATNGAADDLLGTAKKEEEAEENGDVQGTVETVTVKEETGNIGIVEREIAGTGKDAGRGTGRRVGDVQRALAVAMTGGDGEALRRFI